MPQKFDFTKRTMTPDDAKRFETKVFRAIRASGDSISLATLEETCAPLDPTGLGISSTRMAVLHLAEQGRLLLKDGVVTVVGKKNKTRSK